MKGFLGIQGEATEMAEGPCKGVSGKPLSAHRHLLGIAAGITAAPGKSKQAFCLFTHVPSASDTALLLMEDTERGHCHPPKFCLSWNPKKPSSAGRGWSATSWHSLLPKPPLIEKGWGFVVSGNQVSKKTQRTSKHNQSTKAYRPFHLLRREFVTNGKQLWEHSP